MRSILIALVGVSCISSIAGCGYEISHKEITLQDDKGNQQIVYSCGDYMRVVSEGWVSPKFEVTFTDANGLSHDVRGLKYVAVSDIPETMQASMWGFDEYVPGETYSTGAPIKEGDIVLRGDSQARLVGGKWKPVMIHNTVCDKPKSQE